MPRLFLALVLLFLTTAVHAEPTVPAKLSPEELAAGWVQLFDGESDYGWKVEGQSNVNRLFEWILAANTKPTAATSLAHLGAGEVAITYTVARKSAILQLPGSRETLKLTEDSKAVKAIFTIEPGKTGPIVIEVPQDGAIGIHKLAYRPAKTQPIFDGKTLTGWKMFTGEARREKSKVSITEAGELRLTNGPGDLQTEAKYGDFALQLECKIQGDKLNSGVFFRCIADQYQNGYECQIQNGYKDMDRTKPTDYGTGAIYRRQAARKIIANDKEWFHLTLIAVGPTMATYVNGVPVLVWTDTRPKNENPRNGLRLEPGHLSIQGHDPTTDILFRNLRISKWR